MPRMGYNPVAQAVRAIRGNSDSGLPPEVASALGKLERREALAVKPQRSESRPTRSSKASSNNRLWTCAPWPS